MKRWITAATFLFLVQLVTYEREARAIEDVARGKTTINVEKRKKEERKNERAKVSVSRAQIYMGEVEKSLLKGIDKTKKYLAEQAKKRPKGSATRLQFLEKVLNLNLEHAILQRNQEEKDYDKIYDEWEAAGANGKTPKINTEVSNGLWQKTALLAKAILAEYPKAKTADIILYNQAFALEFLGKRQESARMYTQLVQNYPKSPVAGEAYFSLGEFFFDRNDFRNALENYNNANRFKTSKRYGWSLFKYAWCHYNLGAYSQALRAFKLVVSYSRTQGDKGLQLREEALRDMVYVFAERQDVNGAIAYYRANGGRKYIGQMLKLLSQTLADQGKYARAISVAKKLQSSEPYSAEAPEVQKFIIELNNDLNRKAVVWQELDRYGKMYGPKSTWYEKNKENRKLVLEAQKMIRDQMMYYAKLTHKEAIDGDNREAHMQAKRGYELFLKNYPDAPETPEILYNLADIEYYLKRYNEAGKLYLQITLLGPEKALIIDPNSKKTQNIHKQSADYMLGAYGEDYKKDFEALRKTTPDFTKPTRPLTSKAKNYIRACALYTKYYPKDEKKVKACDLDVGSIYYLTNNKKMAKKYLWMIAKKYPDSEEGQLAVDKVLPLYKGDREGLVAAVGELLKVPEYQKGKLGTKLRGLLRDTEIEVVMQEKNPEKQAALFEKLARKNPKGEGADALWYNSAVNYAKTGNLNKAIANYAIVVKYYPSSAQYKEALLQMIKLSEQRYDFVGAVKYAFIFYKKYSADKKNQKEVLAATSMMCRRSIQVGSPKAWTLCDIFAKYDPETASFYQERLIVDAYRNGRNGDVAEMTKKFMNAYKLDNNGVVRALCRLHRIEGSKANSTAANNMVAAYKRAAGKVEGEALRCVSEMVFREAFSQNARFTKVTIQGGTVEAFVASKDKKFAALAQVSGGYNRVFETKDSYWGVAALYEQGRLYQQLAEALENPPGITGASIEDVKKQLAPQAKEARKEAETLFANAAATMEKFNIMSPYSQRIADAASSGGKRKPRDFDQYVVKPDFVASEIPTSMIKQVVK